METTLDEQQSEVSEMKICKNCKYYHCSICHVFLEEREADEPPMKRDCFESE